MQPSVKIQPLTRQFLSAAIQLVDRAFPLQSPLERLSLRLYWAKDRSWFRYLARWVGIQDVRYWVAVTPPPHQVIGTTGLYSHTHDAAEAYWLGWFCVDPQWQGRGIGRQLLEFSITQASQAGLKTS